jgi:tetratricopeptide (TPR) repeat protein
MKNILRSLTRTPRGIFIILSVFLGFLMLYLNSDYGPTEDAAVHNNHGRILLEYFKGINQRAALSPFNENGQLIAAGDATYEQEEIRGMNFYGGFFDLAATFLHDELFPSTDIFALRNFLNAIFGFLCMLFIGLVAKELGNWRTGIVALIFAALTPVLFGHSMNNPKDLPEASLYIMSIYAILRFVKNLPKIKILQVIFLVISISLAINIRVSGIFLIVIFLFFVFMHWFLEAWQQQFQKKQFIDGVILAAKVLGIAMLAWLCTCIFWPYAQTTPFLAIYKVMTASSDFKVLNAYELFEGNWVNTWEIPWYYGPKIILITAPLHLIITFFAIPLIFIQRISNYDRKMRLPFLIVFLAFLLPLLYAIIGHVRLYNNGRHLLFVWGPLISCTAVAFESIVSARKNRKIAVAIYTVAGFLLLQPLGWMVQNHPMEALYFSPVVGGNKGAFQRYEMDYWGFSIKPAADWLADNVENATPEKPARVRMGYGDQLKASYCVDEHPNLKFVYRWEGNVEWNYSIILPAEAKFNKDLLLKWPPENTVYQVMAGGAPVCAIVKNNNPLGDPSIIEQQLALAPSASGYINLSLIYYNKGDYLKCILSCRNALTQDSASGIAYNNMCTAYNSLQMFNEAADAGKKALEIAPDLTLAKNNLKIAQKGIESRKEKPYSAGELLNLSYYYYMLGEYEQCIKQSNEVLKKDPRSAIAYNNICSAYNALGNYAAAAIACKKALEIKPDFDLAKNNLKAAEKAMKP